MKPASKFPDGWTKIQKEAFEILVETFGTTSRKVFATTISYEAVINALYRGGLLNTKNNGKSKPPFGFTR